MKYMLSFNLCVILYAAAPHITFMWYIKYLENCRTLEIQ